jgi:hypothetical protein
VAAHAPWTSNLQRTREALFIALIGFTIQGMALEVHNMKLLWVLLGMAIAYRELSSRSMMGDTGGGYLRNKAGRLPKS